MTAHFRGEFSHKSKALGIRVYRSLCGLSDSLRAPLYYYEGLVDCKHCLQLKALEKAREEKKGQEEE